ncbi:MAG: excinuclease ABC subunit UvrA [Verrucomicrobiae bacterium]|nr:excinuclease ABC subunit UvrA [Verrucomicrobiae bacterium]
MTPGAKDHIVIGGARQHNLKNINLRIPRDKFIVVTGLSGSGKSSLAFDTIHAEGQRKYVESLSAYARQFLEQMQKPDCDFIEGLSPTIAIEQRTSGSNPRSTIATTTEIFDYLRLLFASIGKPHCHQCGRPISSQTVSQIVEKLLSLPQGTRLMLLAPLVQRRKGEYRDVIEKIRRQGFVRVRVDGEILEVGTPIKLEKTRKHTIEAVVDRLVVDEKIRARLADSVETALKWGEGILQSLWQSPMESPSKWNEQLMSTLNACVHCGISYGEFGPQHFSFNNPHGACRECHGLGSKLVFDEDLLIPDPEKSLEDGAIVAWRLGGRRLVLFFKMMLRSLSEHYKFQLQTKWKDLDPKLQKIVLHGSGEEKIEFKHWRAGKTSKSVKPFEGVIPNLMRRLQESQSEFMKRRIERMMSRLRCPECKGARLRPESLAVTVGDKNIIDICKLSVSGAHEFFPTLPLTDHERHIAHEVIKEISSRLGFLVDVGLGYLTLDRESGTLSGGEAQRIRLASQIGAGLVGVIYILDEPSIGLHQRDNGRLLKTLIGLRDLGNTVVVVEHDEETIRMADYIIDLGPGAGVLGGNIVCMGTLEELLASPTSLTAKYLRRDVEIPIPRRRKQVKWVEQVNVRKSLDRRTSQLDASALATPSLEIRGAKENNLKNINVRIPIGSFTCVTGVSGSGKSTLVDDILRRALMRKWYGSKERPGAHDEIRGIEELDKMIVIDQSPIGRTPRSNPATYTGMFNHIRDLFARLPTAKVRGYGPGRFSFNVKGGRCEACAGDGIIKIEMHFLPDVYVQCETCRGKRFSRETLEITYKGKNIADVLEMTVDEAMTFFRAVPQIYDKLSTLAEVGLGYIHLGQQATTLSGGEAQRVKLAAELSRKATGRTLYILDEPTTGLHFADIHKLLEVLIKLREAGNTVLVIEHNLDVIKCADWIVDLGPEGGDAGGRIVAQGPPEKVAEVEQSFTGQFLRQILAQRKPSSTPSPQTVPASQTAGAR